MEAFQLLSRGGVNFDKRRFKSDVELFNQNKPAETSGNKSGLDGDALPPALDFFKYAQKDEKGKRKADPRQMEEEVSLDQKRRRTDSIIPTDPSVKKHRVTVKGENVPIAAESFEELGERYHMSGHLLANLSKYGFNTPTGIQSHAVPILQENRDLAAISPTGTGKTLSYLLPVLSLLGAPISSNGHGVQTGTGVRAVIVVPTRELAHQIHNECLKLTEGRKWRIVLFNKATANTLADKSVRDKIDLIISTPLRLIQSLQNGILELGNVRHLVLDEADRLLDTEFLSQTQEIVASCTLPSVQKAVFSATLPAGVEKIAMEMLSNPIRVVVGLKDTPLPSIAQTLTYVADDFSKLPTLLQFLRQPYKPPIIAFTSTQTRASALAEQLIIEGIPNVGCLHAGMTKKERTDTVSCMLKGEVWVLISTEVMARGMDFKGIRGVINYDFPTSVQSYIHRIGRTGRAGREGIAITYFTDEDSPYLKPIANVLLQSGSTVPDWISKLPKPSKLKRRQMGKIKRADAVTKASIIGRKEAIKKRDMIRGSKSRRLKEKLQSRSEPKPSEAE